MACNLTLSEGGGWARNLTLSFPTQQPLRKRSRKLFPDITNYLRFKRTKISTKVQNTNAPRCSTLGDTGM